MRHKLFALAALACALTLPAFVAPAPGKAPVQAVDTFPTTCPVNGDTIETASKAAATSVYQGKTYYFCCERYKTAFDENPTKYVEPVAPKTSNK